MVRYFVNRAPGLRHWSQTKVLTFGLSERESDPLCLNNWAFYGDFAVSLRVKLMLNCCCYTAAVPPCPVVARIVLLDIEGGVRNVS